jgi:cytochrome b involved in lipid metabolism
MAAAKRVVSPRELATKTKSGALWLAISGKVIGVVLPGLRVWRLTACLWQVYDVTEFVKGHPGGSAIVEAACGKDATTEFEETGVPSSPPRRPSSS